LYVGGDGGNGAFHKSLSGAGQKVDDYQARHQALVAKVTKSGGSASESYSTDDPTSFSYVQATKLSTKSYEGVCFLDVFGAKLCPKGNSKNAAMLYVAPPDGNNYPVESDFLRDITLTASYAIEAIAGYNAVAAQQGLAPVEALRSILFSSNIYNPVMPKRPKVGFDTIARAIFAGYTSGLTAQKSGLKELQLPYSSDPKDPIFAAVEADMSKNS
jgi:hypothetical protein